MSLQTVKELNAQEEAARARAFKYGRAMDTTWTANERLKNLEAKLATPQVDASVLREMVSLAKKMPAGITTQGNRLVPGGQNLQALIIGEIEIALGVLADQRKALEDELPIARERAIDANARLAAFNE